MLSTLASVFGRADETRVSVRGAPEFRMRRSGDRVVGRRRAYEPASLQLWVALSRLHEGHVLDVGAYTGVYAHAAASANSDKVVWAFEPVPSILTRLRENVEFSGLGNIVPVGVAVSDRSGTVEMIQRSKAEMTTGSSMVDKNGKEIQARFSVPSVSIDDFVESKHIANVAAIKIDVESAEHLVVAGMASTLERFRPGLILEIIGASDAEAVTASLVPFGYRFYAIGETDFSITRMDTLRRLPKRGDHNFLCTTASTNEVAHLAVSAGLSVVT